MLNSKNIQKESKMARRFSLTLNGNFIGKFEQFELDK